MSRVCQVTGKHPVTRNNRSHALNATKHHFLPNLPLSPFLVESENILSPCAYLLKVCM